MLPTQEADISDIWNCLASCLANSQLVSAVAGYPCRLLLSPIWLLPPLHPLPLLLLWGYQQEPQLPWGWCRAAARAHSGTWPSDSCWWHQEGLWGTPAPAPATEKETMPCEQSLGPSECKTKLIKQNCFLKWRLETMNRMFVSFLRMAADFQFYTGGFFTQNTPNYVFSLNLYYISGDIKLCDTPAITDPPLSGFVLKADEHCYLIWSWRTGFHSCDMTLFTAPFDWELASIIRSCNSTLPAASGED